MMTGLLFWFQVVMAWTYMVPQVMQISGGKTGGLTLAMWAIFMGYLSVILSLALLAYREKKETIRLYTVIIFAQWSAFILILFIMAIRSVRWSPNDTVVCAAIVGLSIMTVLKNGLNDPMTRGWLAVWCKALPQLWIAYVMWTANSAEWLPGLSLMATNATCIPRLVQVYLQGKRGGWDRATKGLFLGESANVASWAVVNIVWCILTF
jgi:amino acid transporter